MLNHIPRLQTGAIRSVKGDYKSMAEVECTQYPKQYKCVRKNMKKGEWEIEEGVISGAGYIELNDDEIVKMWHC